ncbi:MAG TPA: YbaK/EbsC family protein [Gemmataceae bacterium]|nr:YbaK/EbsC family protein [Bryobacteraceae bacterium]HZV04193.1 YbaK/EbsC family protein [Gemmataceae bacterium]
MPATKLKEFLDAHQVKYVTIRHSAAYTAQEIAALAHIRGKELAKTVMVKVDGKMAMAVLPASFKISIDLLKKAAGAASVELAAEAEFKSLFPDCETGAMPPFGNLYGISVFACASLSKDTEIAFNAGSHNELIRMAYKDFEALVQPAIAEFSAQP